MKTRLATLIALLVLLSTLLVGCEEMSASSQDAAQTIDIGNKLASNQPTPTDIDYSLERWNLVRRAYWVNGQREKAINYPCEIADRPLGYVVLFTESGSIVGRFVVDGKVSSLNSYLTPDSQVYEMGDYVSSSGFEDGDNHWLPDVDGTFGTNSEGIFFFTPDSRYIEWSGTYLYSDIPFEIEDPVVAYEEKK